ncbi:hypothetical protein [Herbidospora cretacea]|nr:hypothetical protein [Herbidospora cretacea]
MITAQPSSTVGPRVIAGSADDIPVMVPAASGGAEARLQAR